ncbi:MAG: 50S ribosomal protein L4 [Bdellovibrionota bacterium]|nr:50S ribosomal protein L4 [Deltaproteobacteria bacterium]
MKANIIKQNGTSQGTVDLNKTVFGAEVSKALLFENVIMQRANMRQGTAKTKERSDVSGGGRKPYKQKGTGNARQGSTRAPNHVGGGTVFGPRVRDYSYKLPKKMRSKALISALSQKQAQGQIVVFEEFKLDTPKTKDGIAFLGDLRSTYTLVVDKNNANLAKSVRNIKRTKYIDVDGINVLDLLRYNNLLISTSALTSLEERLAS